MPVQLQKIGQLNEMHANEAVDVLNMVDTVADSRQHFRNKASQLAPRPPGATAWSLLGEVLMCLLPVQLRKIGQLNDMYANEAVDVLGVVDTVADSAMIQTRDGKDVSPLPNALLLSADPDSTILVCRHTAASL